MFNTSKDKNSMSLDLVYVPVDMEEFRSIHVDISTKHDKLEIIINSEWDVTIEDFESLINKLQRNTLTKMRINIERDCELSLFIKGKPYAVEFAPSLLKIDSIEPKTMEVR